MNTKKYYIYTFVVLHYLVVQDTIECVKSIKAIEKNNNQIIYIIIVDNGSLETDKDEIMNTVGEDIIYLRSDLNLGFAKGNNIGFNYAQKNLKSDYVILTNNDIIINNSNFSLGTIDLCYEKYHFAVLGPNILAGNKKICQNPHISKSFNKYSIISYIVKSIIMYLLTLFHMDTLLFKKPSPTDESSFFSFDSSTVDITKIDTLFLHGSFLIFSPQYYSKEGLFDGTFMYLEENILKYLCKKNGCKLYYTSLLSVYHKEDASTNALTNSDRKKKLFYFKNVIKSALIFCKLLWKQ